MDLEVLPSSVRIPGSVGAAPVCWNEGLVGGGGGIETPSAVGGVPPLPTGARAPTANYSPRIPAPPSALEFVVTISGTGVWASVADP